MSQNRSLSEYQSTNAGGSDGSPDSCDRAGHRLFTRGVAPLGALRADDCRCAGRKARVGRRDARLEGLIRPEQSGRVAAVQTCNTPHTLFLYTTAHSPFPYYTNLDSLLFLVLFSISSRLHEWLRASSFCLHL